jgi:hypothetical protein
MTSSENDLDQTRQIPAVATYDPGNQVLRIDFEDGPHVAEINAVAVFESVGQVTQRDAVFVRSSQPPA